MTTKRRPERPQFDKSAASPSSRQRIQGLDVARGIAVGLVMLTHAWPGIFGGAGIVGVTTFFALSGYLITGLLLRDFDERGRLRLGRFYVHRVCRLYPALLALLAGFCVVSLLLHTQSAHGLAKSVVVGALYLADLPSNHLVPAKGLSHLWTLAVEEQFYLVWPWVLLLGMRARRIGLTLSITAAVLVAASVLLPVVTSVSVQSVYQSPTSWAITLLMGSAARIYARRLAALCARTALVAAAVLVLVVVSLLPRADKNIVEFLLLGPVVAAAAVVLVLSMERQVHVPVATRPLLALGVISYAAYLWNFPITVWLPPRDFTTMPLGWGLVSVLLTVAAAALSWVSVERFGRYLRMRYDARARLPALA